MLNESAILFGEKLEASNTTLIGRNWMVLEPSAICKESCDQAKSIAITGNSLAKSKNPLHGSFEVSRDAMTEDASRIQSGVKHACYNFMVSTIEYSKFNYQPVY